MMRYYDKMINLNEVHSFAQGGNRKCYINPNNPQTCLKVGRQDIIKDIKSKLPWYKKLRVTKSFDDNLREEQAYKQNAIRNASSDSVWDHLAKWHGMVETTMGPASETELIQNNNEIAETLETYLFREGLTKEIIQSISVFEHWLREYLVLTKNIIPHNIVIKRDKKLITLKIVDGLGCKSFIPLPKYSKFFAKIYVERRIKLFWSRIHWDLSGRHGEWK